MRLSYRKTIISFRVPLQLSHGFFSTKSCVNLLHKYKFPIGNITLIRSTLFFE